MPLVFKECVIFSYLFLTPVKYFAFFPSEVSCSSPCKCCGDVQKANWPHPWVPTHHLSLNPKVIWSPVWTLDKLKALWSSKNLYSFWNEMKIRVKNIFTGSTGQDWCWLYSSCYSWCSTIMWFLNQAFILPCTPLAYLQNCEAVHFKGPWQRIKKTIFIGHQA